MKVRNGFVSNSSSSSFCIIGVGYKLAEQMAKAQGISFDWEDDNSVEFNEETENGITYIGGEGDLCCAGVQAYHILQKFTLPEAKVEVQKLIKEKLNLDIPLSAIDLEYGEVYG